MAQIRNSENRNIGFITAEEQQLLRNSTVAIAGIGGVGGFPAERLARLGIGGLRLADPEPFEETDINRQFGSGYRSVRKSKCETLREILLDINPRLSVDLFPQGVSEDNIDRFLDGADIVIDAIEIAHVPERVLLYQGARKRGQYVVLSGAGGFGAPLFVFDPRGMTFEEYFEIPSDPEIQRSTRMNIDKMHPFKDRRSGYIEPELVRKMAEGSIPFSCLAPTCGLAGCLLANEALLLLLGKRPPTTAPDFIFIDMFHQRIFNGQGAALPVTHGD